MFLYSIMHISSIPRIKHQTSKHNFSCSSRSSEHLRLYIFEVKINKIIQIHGITNLTYCPEQYLVNRTTNQLIRSKYMYDGNQSRDYRKMKQTPAEHSIFSHREHNINNKFSLLISYINCDWLNWVSTKTGQV